MKYLSLSRSQQLYVGLVILVVVPAVTALALQPELYDFYLEHFVRPDLERQFGFKAGRVQLPAEAGGHQQFAIVGVLPGGVLDKAGVRPGDLPVGYKHGFASGFYLDLLSLRRGEPIEIRLVSVSDSGKGWKAWRKVRVEPAAR